MFTSPRLLSLSLHGEALAAVEGGKIAALASWRDLGPVLGEALGSVEVVLLELRHHALEPAPSEGTHTRGKHALVGREITPHHP